MQDLLELAVSAAASGCIYGLIALAYLLMIRPTGIINFAVGEWAMVAAFGGFIVARAVARRGEARGTRDPEISP